MLYRIIYLSSAVSTFNKVEKEDMLLKAKAYNKLNNITGILIYFDGNFIQILEGEKENVIELYNKIQADKRHKNIIKVIEDQIKKRQFEEWNMGFSEIMSNDFSSLNEFKRFDLKNIFSKADFIAETFLTTFLKSHRGLIT